LAINPTEKMLLKKLLFIVVLLCTNHWAMAQDGEQEANLKAAFIYNFTKYIDWGSYNSNYMFVIGVVGDDSPVIPALREIAKSRTINNKRIEIRIIDNLSKLRDCDVVFITKQSRFPLSSILNRLGLGVLTIGESDGYASRGTDFNFVVVNDKLKFEANLNAIAASGLKAGSQLLKLAIIVDGDNIKTSY